MICNNEQLRINAHEIKILRREMDVKLCEGWKFTGGKRAI